MQHRLPFNRPQTFTGSIIATTTYTAKDQSLKTHQRLAALGSSAPQLAPLALVLLSSASLIVLRHKE
jgi:hypothetical protein